MEQDILTNLKRFEVPKIGVYFLFSENKLIYIGESSNIFQRIQSHITNKFFDSYGFVVCESKQEAVELEKQMIVKYRPTLNIKHKKESIEFSIQYHLECVEKLNRLKEFFKIE